MAINGNTARITINGIEIEDVVSEDFGLKTAMIDITSKTSAGNKEVMNGLREQTLNFEAIHEKKPGGASAVYLSDFASFYASGTPLTYTYSVSNVAGDVKFTGSAYVTDVQVKAAANDKVTYSVTLAPTGGVVVGTV